MRYETVITKNIIEKFTEFDVFDMHDLINYKTINEYTTTDIDNHSRSREKSCPMPPIEVAKEMRTKIDNGEYREALQLGTDATSNGIMNPVVMEAMLYLTAKIRSTCMDMASRKAEGQHYWDLENLLGQANVLTGEDVYGRRR